MSNATRRCTCGKVFHDQERRLCMECSLSLRDHIRVVEGPTNPGRGTSRFGPFAWELSNLTRSAPQPDLNQRLSDGFHMLEGGQLRR